ncbi:MAG: DNA-binding protein Alba [Candidatus Hodarchaeota archaeon]
MSENVIYVGNKPVMNYVLACVTQLNQTDMEEIVIKARGRAISRAVDVAEILRNRFMSSVDVKDIKISTEQINTAEGGTANVSAVEISLGKKGAKPVKKKK